VEAGERLEEGEADVRGCMEAFLVAILLPGRFRRYIYTGLSQYMFKIN
jgi:hypothetical protein